MSKSNTKSKTAYEEKTGLFVCAYSCVQNQLDTADFLIDGLTSRRASGADIRVVQSWPRPLSGRSPNSRERSLVRS
jgi:hypothetical protein